MGGEGVCYTAGTRRISVSSIYARRGRAMIEGVEARVAKLEGEMALVVKRLDSMDNWLRVIVGLQVTTLIAVIAAMIRLAG